MKILCITPVIGDPKDSKRIDLIKETGAAVTVASFERDYFKSRVPDAPIITLAKIDHAKYFVRIFIYLKVLFKLRKLCRNADIIYTFSPDLAFLTYAANMFSQKPLVIDVADIRGIQLGKSVVSRVYRTIDKYISARAALIVVTAKAFDDWYYQHLLRLKTNTLVIENKVDYDLTVPVSPIDKDKVFTIGYFGVIRSRWSIDLLNRLAGLKMFRIQISGIFLFDNNEDVLNSLHPDIVYTGTYKSPDDLETIYAGVDLILAVYPEPFTTLTDEVFANQICRSNRFYEACYFQKPILSMQDSGDAAEIANYNIGMVFESYDIVSCIKMLQRIDADLYTVWSTNMRRMNPDVYSIKNEKTTLKHKLTEIYNKQV